MEKVSAAGFGTLEELVQEGQQLIANPPMLISYVEVDMNIAATKAGEIGCQIKISGEPTDEQIEAAVLRAEKAIVKAISVRARGAAAMRAIQDGKVAITFDPAIWGNIPQE